MFDVRLSECVSVVQKFRTGKKHSPNDRKRKLTNCHLSVAGSINFPYATCLCVFLYDDVMMAPADFLTAYHVIYIKFTFFFSMDRKKTHSFDSHLFVLAVETLDLR